MSETRRRLDRVLSSEFVADIDALDLTQLRERRRMADEVENELSFYRRMLHGRIDLLRFELRRRRGEERRSLIEALPHILADAPGGNAESSASQRPRHVVADLPPLPDVGKREVDQVLGTDIFARLDEIDETEIERAIAGLIEVEERISEQRRRVQAVADRLAKAVADRYRHEGESDSVVR